MRLNEEGLRGLVLRICIVLFEYFVVWGMGKCMLFYRTVLLETWGDILCCCELYSLCVLLLSLF